jgi:hypothetical protein
MEERWRLVLWAFVGGGLGMAAGGLFGALAALLARRRGSKAGSFMGRHVAAQIARLRDEPLSDRAQAILIGGADGGFFLGLVGLLAGGWAGWSGRVDAGIAATVGFTILALMLFAAVLGYAAHGLLRIGIWALGAPCLGSLFGAALGGRIGGAVGIMLGVLIGALVGSLAVAAYLLIVPGHEPEQETNPP